MLGFVVGLVAEKRIAKRLGGLVTVGNGTADGAREAVDRVIQQGATALVSFGFAGGLDPDAAAGRIIIPSFVITASGMLDCDEALVRRLGGPSTGRLLGSEAVVATTAEKARLFAQTGATGVDLESGAVAVYASARRMPFAALRVVCDRASVTLPRTALTALDSRGKIRPLAIIADLARRPGEILPLIKLASDASVARRSLAHHVAGLAARS